MKYTVEYHPKFIKDMKKLGLSKNQKLNVIDKVDAISVNLSQNLKVVMENH